MAQNPAWTTIRYQGAIWAILMAALAASGEMSWGTAILIACAGATLTSAASLGQRGEEKGGLFAPRAASATGDRAPPDALTAEAKVALDALPTALLAVARSRDIAWANAAARRLLDVEPAGKPLLSVLRDPQLTDALESAWRDRKPAHGIELAIPPGRTISVDIGLIGEDSQALLLIADVSAEKRHEALRSDFIANVSHELKTPISAILGIAETLAGPAREDQAARENFLGIMRGQAERMNRLVGDLLSLSRIELQEHARPEGLVDLGQIVRTAGDALHLKLAAKAMRLEIDGGAWPKARGDGEELTQVFQNLIDNAIKYGRDNTPVAIKVSLSREPGTIRRHLPALREAPAMVSISVIDQGPGIAREHLPRLTERFYRVDAARSRDLGGTGLGLAIVKHIVNRHRGTLEIQSEPGQGSTFIVHLPVEPD